MTDHVTGYDRQALQQEVRPQPGERARAALLRMGKNMESQGYLYHAMYTYHKLLEDYPDTRTSRAAMNALIDLAESAEEQGLIYLATVLFNEIDKLDEEGIG